MMLSNNLAYNKCLIIWLLILIFCCHQTRTQTLSLFAGPTLDNVPFKGAVLDQVIHGMAYDAAQNLLYIVEFFNHRVRVVNMTSGIIAAFAGTGVSGYNGDNILATNAQLNSPRSIALDTVRNVLYIADMSNRRIRMVNRATRIITTIAGSGFSGDSNNDVPAVTAQVYIPIALAIDVPQNFIYIVEQLHRVRYVNRTSGLIHAFAGTGVSGYNGDNGPATDARLLDPTNIAVDVSNNLVYIVDSGNHCIRAVNRATSIITTFSGNGSPGFSGNSPIASSQYNRPVAIALDSTSNIVYIADGGNYRIRAANRTSNIVTTIAGTGVQGVNSENVTATSATLNVLSALTVIQPTILFVAHQYYVIHKIERGIIASVGGSDAKGFFGDNGLAKLAKLNGPIGVTVNGSRVYISDTSNNRIRMVDRTTGIITTVVGSGATSPIDNVLANSTGLNNPNHMAVDGPLLYIADVSNSRIRVVNASGIITTFAGSSIGFSGDGALATSAQLKTPKGISIDTLNNLVYIADSGNHRIRVVNRTSNIITTIAGTGTAGFNADNIAATSAHLNQPYSLAVDPASSQLYIADTINCRVRVVNLITGIIRAFAGTGVCGPISGDNGLATNAQLQFPSHVHVDSINKLVFIADSTNFRVRVVSIETNIIVSVAGAVNLYGYIETGALVSSPIAGFNGLDWEASTKTLFIADTNNNRVRMATLCNMGTIATANSTCQACATGYYSNQLGAYSCQFCPTGSYANTTGSTKCTLCESGTFSMIPAANTSSACQPCAPGYFSTEGASSCNACSVGSFANITGSTSCQLCPAGYFASSTASASCIACSNGLFSSTIGASSATTCQTCSLSTYSENAGSDTCQSCPLGTVTTTTGAISRNACQPCNAGTVASLGSPQCLPCAQGSFSNSSGASFCYLCPFGTFSNVIGGNSSNVCQPCAMGTFANNFGSAICQSCPAGSVSSIGQSFCSPCAAGSYSNSTHCILCDAGSYNSISGAASPNFCIPCPRGTISTRGESFCQQCAAGTFAAEVGSSVCSPCAKGTFNSAAGASNCLNCTLGTFSESLGASMCQSCPLGTASNTIGASSSAFCFPCSGGNYSGSVGSSTCQQCKPGTFSQSLGSTRYKYK